MQCLCVIMICCVSPPGASSFVAVAPTSSSNPCFRVGGAASSSTGNKNWQSTQQVLPKYSSSSSRSCSSSSSGGTVLFSSSNGSTSGIINDVVNTIENPILNSIDKVFVGPIVRISNHIPALLSLYYFGLISMASMMIKSGSSMDMAGPATLSSVLTRFVGSTSNGDFSQFFPTLITPSTPIFLVWPIIAISQVLTLAASSVLATVNRRPIFEQHELTALSLSNLLATAWIIISSQATVGMLPLGSALILPLVPLLSGYALRKKTTTDNTYGLGNNGISGGRKKRKRDIVRTKAANFVFQLFSSFTSIASLLALTVELQHGNRLFPSLFYQKPEVSSLVFLAGYLGIVSRGRNGNGGGKNKVVKRLVNAVAISGILAKRIMDANTAPGGVMHLLTSLSFWITSLIAAQATAQLF